MKSYQELLAEAKARVREITVREALPLLEEADVLFLDVRDAN
jgi:hypothetical protein